MKGCTELIGKNLELLDTLHGLQYNLSFSRGDMRKAIEMISVKRHYIKCEIAIKLILTLKFEIEK